MGAPARDYVPGQPLLLVTDARHRVRIRRWEVVELQIGDDGGEDETPLEESESDDAPPDTGDWELESFAIEE